MAIMGRIARALLLHSNAAAIMAAIAARQARRPLLALSRARPSFPYKNLHPSSLSTPPSCSLTPRSLLQLNTDARAQVSPHGAPPPSSLHSTVPQCRPTSTGASHCGEKEGPPYSSAPFASTRWRLLTGVPPTLRAVVRPLPATTEPRRAFLCVPRAALDLPGQIPSQTEPRSTISVNSGSPPPSRSPPVLSAAPSSRLSCRSL